MKILEIGVYQKNVGDQAIRNAFFNLLGQEFDNPELDFMSCRKIYTEEDIEIINKYDLVILAGGGLLIHDSFPNEVSDWQWGISAELLKQIKTPIAVLGIGFNQFKGQRAFNNKFKETMRTLVERSVFFGMRNTGSIEKLKQYLPQRLHNKLTLFHCPTTTMSRYYDIPYQEGKGVGFVIGGDRLSFRHHGQYHKFVEQLRHVNNQLQKGGVETYLLLHEPSDIRIANYVDFNHVYPLYYSDIDHVLQTYSKLSTVVSDRKHGLLLPFSVGTRIIGIPDHPEIRYMMYELALEDHIKNLRYDMPFDSYLDIPDWYNVWWTRFNYIKCHNDNQMRLLKKCLGLQ